MARESVDYSPCMVEEDTDREVASSLIKNTVKREIDEPREVKTSIKKRIKIPRANARIQSHVKSEGTNASEENLLGPVLTTPTSSIPEADDVEVRNATSLPQKECEMPPVVAVAHLARQIVNIHGFRVMNYHAPIVEQIFAKYGDISSDCKFCMPGIKRVLMESVINIVRLFQRHTGRSLSAQQAEFIQNCLHDLELSKFNVGWLKERYNAAVALSEHAKDVSKHVSLCNEIEKVEAQLAELKSDRDLVAARMEKRRRILVPGWEEEMDLDKPLGVDLL